MEVGMEAGVVERVRRKHEIVADDKW